MSCPIGIFNPRNIIVLLNVDGIETRIEGWADGDFVSVDPNSERANVQVGADGRAVANYSADQSVNIRFSLMAQSPSNRFLGQLDAGKRQFGVSVSSPETGEFGVSACAIIKTRPNRSYGAEAGNREWMVFANDWVEDAQIITALT